MHSGTARTWGSRSDGFKDRKRGRGETNPRAMARARAGTESPARRFHSLRPRQPLDRNPVGDPDPGRVPAANHDTTCRHTPRGPGDHITPRHPGARSRHPGTGDRVRLFLAHTPGALRRANSFFYRAVRVQAGKGSGRTEPAVVRRDRGQQGARPSSRSEIGTWKTLAAMADGREAGCDGRSVWVSRFSRAGFPPPWRPFTEPRRGNAWAKTRHSSACPSCRLAARQGRTRSPRVSLMPRARPKEARSFKGMAPGWQQSRKSSHQRARALLPPPQAPGSDQFPGS